MKPNDNSLIEAMINIIEIITDEKVELKDAFSGSVDFSNYQKIKSKTELGGFIPQQDSMVDIDYCVDPDVACNIIKRV